MISFSFSSFPLRSRFGLTNCSSLLLCFLCIFIPKKYPVTHLHAAQIQKDPPNLRKGASLLVCCQKICSHTVFLQLPHKPKVVCFFFIDGHQQQQHSFWFRTGKIILLHFDFFVFFALTASGFSSYLLLLIQGNYWFLLVMLLLKLFWCCCCCCCWIC